MSGTLLADARPVARKNHQCSDCFGVIPAGQSYVNQRSIYDGHHYTYKAHPLCFALWLDSGSEGEDWSAEAGQESLCEWFRNLAALAAPQEPTPEQGT